MAKFVGQIYLLGINPVVDPPERVLQRVFDEAGKSRGPIRVKGELNGTGFIQTLVRYRGVWRLYINGEMLNAAGVRVGDSAKIEIEFDPRTRDIPIPPALALALDSDRRAKTAFGYLPPSRQKEIFRYIGSLKTDQSIARNVEKILRQLNEGIIEKPLATGRKRRSGE